MNSTSVNFVSGIYKITSPSKREYIGQAKHIRKRWEQYKYYERDYECVRIKNKTSLIYKSFIKYGLESHKFEVIEYCDVDKLNDREIYYIEKYKTFFKKYPSKRGLNLHEGGNVPPCSLGRIVSVETKTKISIKNKLNHAAGKYKYPNNKPIIKKNLNGEVILKYNTLQDLVKHEDFSLSKFYRNFIEFNKCFIGNFVFSFENPTHFKYKIQQPKVQRIKKEKQKKSAEELFKISQKRKEYAKSLGLSNKGRIIINRKKPKKTEKMLFHLSRVHQLNKKPIDQLDMNGNLIATFPSIKDAAAAVNGDRQPIYSACTNKIKRCYGFMWRYNCIK